ncbi:hypothetical protein GALMADRAFT_219065 [Galerina marginata CBS 339.88]|uniref:Uncharacterized protein n=1 Tax=Galerina marginata (strain CBS 339.88) TaxID=685588 RepID=A0A067TUN2_GALM3|nr:hypothetical protein GALMADRAFT_219065 [Galerina marginata CBS 339.88]
MVLLRMWMIRFQEEEDDSWVQKLSANRGGGRVILKQRAEGVKIHRTVQLRMKMKQENGNTKKPSARIVPDINQHGLTNEPS